MKESCPFCNIDEEKARVIEDTPLYFVAFSNPRLVDGHLLVIPKRHIEKPWELTQDERAVVFDTVLRYQQIIIKNFATGCDVQQNLRPFLPESRVKVDHVHYHLKPREFNDDLHQVTQGQNALWKDLTREYIERFEALYGKG